MRKTDCQTVRREIEEAAPGDLLSSRVSDHLMNCVACETLSREQAKLQAIVSSLGTIEAPGDFDFRLRARLAAEKQRAAQRFMIGSLSFSGNSSYGSRAAVVATLLLIIGAALVFVNFSTRSNNQQVADSKNVSSPTSNQPVPDVVKTSAPEVALGPEGNQDNVINASVGSREPRTSKRREFKGELATLRDTNGMSTKDSSGTLAPVLKSGNQVAETYPTSAFPINASNQPLKVSVDNGRGSSRTISLPAVSFGSERALSQNASPQMAIARGAW